VSSIPDPETKPTMSVEAAGKLFHLSRQSAYQAVARGEIPSLRFGRRLVVPTAAVLEMLGLRQPAEDGAGPRHDQ
jgi:excisionase family DNA binding protein